MDICLRACVRVFRHARLPSYVPACLGSCPNVRMNGSTRAEINTINGLFTSQPLHFYSLGGGAQPLVDQFLAILITARISPVWSLRVVIKFVNANAVYLSLSVSPCAIAHCVRIPMMNMFISDGLSPPWDCVYWHSLCGVNQTCWTIGSWRCCLCLNFVSSIPAGSATMWVIGRFPQPDKKQYDYLCMYACVRVCVHAYTHACMSVSMHVSHASTEVLSNIYGEANNI